MWNLVGFLFVIACIVGGVWIAAWFNNKRRAQWREEADQLGLDYDDRNLITGSLGGVEIKVELLWRDYTVTAFESTIADTPIMMRVRQKPLGKKLLKATELVAAYEVHDAEFDRKFLVEGNSEGQLREWLTPARRAVMLDLAARFEKLEFGDRKIQVEILGALQNPGELEAAIRDFVSTIRPFHSSHENTVEPLELEDQREPVIGEYGSLFDPEVAVESFELEDIQPIPIVGEHDSLVDIDLSEIADDDDDDSLW